MAYSNVKKGLITTVVIEKVIQAKRELKLQQSQLYVCMYVSMYAVTLLECNNYTRMHQALSLIHI